MRDVNLEAITDKQSRWIHSYLELTKSFSSRQKTKSFILNHSLELGKSCEESSWNHCTSTPYRSETNGVAERAVRRSKEGASAVRRSSRQKMVKTSYSRSQMEQLSCLEEIMFSEHPLGVQVQWPRLDEKPNCQGGARSGHV